MSVSEIQLFQILKSKLGEKEAEELVLFVKNEVKAEFENRKEGLATKEDISSLHKSMYILGLVQFLAIVGSVLMIVNFMIR